MKAGKSEREGNAFPWSRAAREMGDNAKRGVDFFLSRKEEFCNSVEDVMHTMIFSTFSISTMSY